MSDSATKPQAFKAQSSKDVLSWMATDLAKLHVIVSDGMTDVQLREEGMRLLSTLMVSVGAMLSDVERGGAK
jgi:hypothetical protein